MVRLRYTKNGHALVKMGPVRAQVNLPQIPGVDSFNQAGYTRTAWVRTLQQELRHSCSVHTS
ncbi:hypothetical protein J6590_082958 [Homalodisca vitripennis]|nr:hypothetical protein J6590_082958 [Homalodisca vitripennis]